MKNVFVCLLLLLFVPKTFAQSSPGDNEKFKAAQKAYEEKKYDDAARGFEQANKSLGGHCAVCLLNASEASLRLYRRDEALKLSAKAIDAAATPQEKFEAHIYRSQLLLRIDPNDKEQAAAEAEAQKAVALQPDSTPAHIALGMAQLRQKKDEVGITELKWVESRLPEGAEKRRLQAIIVDPRRAREQFAPEFTATTSDGKQLTLADTKGKIVLIDFWATWCPPCRASVPEIKELRRKYGPDRLIILSVSADNKKEDWSEYIAKHDMTWLQSWDRSNKPSVLESFEVHSFPTYVLFDGEGIVRERVNGLDEHQTLTSRLHDQLNKLLK
jgi:thiol-disulfide isomerase/thioredoxin